MKILTGALIALVVLLAVLGTSLYFVANPQVKEVPVPVRVPVIDSTVPMKIDALEAKINSLDEFETEADEKLQNDTAKALVLAEIAGRDFKKDVFSILEENKSVEDYKDLTIYSVKIDSVELGDDNTAEVEVIFKVSGFEDADEESDFKARLTATFLVEDLDVDEIAEAEVADTEITLEKFYD